MAGTYSGTFRTVSSAGDAFYKIALFFDAHPGYTRIASYAGAGANPTLFPNSTASGRWGVWKQTGSGSNNWNIFIAISDSTDAITDQSGSYYQKQFNNNPYGVGWFAACAWHSSSVAWNGTTANTGTDNFSYATGGRMWKDNSIVLPCDNSEFYSDWVSGTYPNRAANMGVPSPNLWIGADFDSFFIASAENNAQVNSAGGFLFQKYVPITSSFTLPYSFQSFFQGEPVASTYSNQGIFSPGYCYGGITVAKRQESLYNSNSDFAKYLTGSYGLTITVPTILETPQTAAPAYWTAMRNTGPFSSSLATVLMYPYLYSIGEPFGAYVGYSEFTYATPGFNSGDTIGSARRIAFGSQNGQFCSSSFPWSSSFPTPTGRTAYNNLPYPRTASVGTVPVAYSNLYDEEIRVLPTPQKQYRWFILGAYNYGETPPPGATDITLIFDPLLAS